MTKTSPKHQRLIDVLTACKHLLNHPHMAAAWVNHGFEGIAKDIDELIDDLLEDCRRASQGKYPPDDERVTETVKDCSSLLRHPDLGKAREDAGLLRDFETTTENLNKFLGACVQVEYDLSYYGGDYDNVGSHVYVPLAEIDRHGSMEAAFAAVTGISSVHIVYWSPDELYTPDGVFFEDFLDDIDRSEERVSRIERRRLSQHAQPHAEDAEAPETGLTL